MMETVHCSPAPAALLPRTTWERTPAWSLRMRENGMSMAIASARKQLRTTFVLEKDTDLEQEIKGVRLEQEVRGRRIAGETNKQGVKYKKGSRRAVHGALDYLDLLSQFTTEDGGPPRWFCPVLNQTPPENAPLLFSLPGIVGTGVELIVHQESLGRLFHLCCLHIPMMDRTPFEDLVSIVEGTIREEARLAPGRPIYLVGENFGGALALALAARNPRLDLVLILVNPSTSFDRSSLQPFLPVLRALPPPVFNSASWLMRLLGGGPGRFMLNKLANTLPPFVGIDQVSEILGDITSTLPMILPKIANSLSQETLLWKLQLLQASTQYLNPRLRGVQAEVLVLASAGDELLPSLEEAKRLSKTLVDCTYREFEQKGHMLLLEKDVDLATVIKGTGLYRQKNVKDPVSNYVPPTEEEKEKLYDSTKLLRRFVSPVFFSQGDDGQVVQGLSKIPSKGPLIFVGIHSLLGLDMKILGSELIKDRQLLARGLAHPIMFDKQLVADNPKFFDSDVLRLFGIVPVSGKNMYKILAKGDNVVLYPGGAREALHRKGEAYKLFWPEQSEFVKMAAKFGATIIPMCTVGEDDMLDMLMDFDEMANIPVLGDRIVEFFKELPTLRDDLDGEISKQILHTPLIAPKLPGPGRMYVFFGRPIFTEGKRDYFRDQKNVDATYQQVRGEVESGIAYLLKKREEDPYRSFLPRVLYELPSEGTIQAPTFKP